MELKDYVVVREFLDAKKRLIGGKITRWSPIYPLLPPLTATILDIEDVQHEGTDFRDIIVRTDVYVSTVPGSPLFAYRDFGFSVDPMVASICWACPDLWVVAIPLRGFAHLQYHHGFEIVEKILAAGS